MQNAQVSTSSLSVLVVDDEPNIRKTVLLCLESQGHKAFAVSNPRDAETAIIARVFDLAFVDIRLGTESGLDLVPKLAAACPWMKIVVITAYASIETAVEAIRRGATDYLPKPFTPGQVDIVTQKVASFRALENRISVLQDAISQSYPEAELESDSPQMQQVIALARQVAPSNATVLIRGESGTGKGVLARAIHAWSSRAQKSFSLVSCPSLSAELLESELFGHVQGSFTGATRDHAGRIAMCQGGTLFLDEIGDLPLKVQPKLLRFLQERSYERVGDSQTREADVRIIAATNQDLQAAVKSGTFREDLLYRLNVIQLEVPPLREHSEDIAKISAKLVGFFSRQNHKRSLTINMEVQNILAGYSWPGNVRELRNVLERCVILCRSGQIGVEHLPPGMAATSTAVRLGDRLSLDQIEEEHIRRVLANCPSLEEAAQVLGIDSATLWRRRKKYGI